MQTLWVQEDGLENRTACIMTSSKVQQENLSGFKKEKLPVVLFQRTLRAVNQSPQSHKGGSRGNPRENSRDLTPQPQGGFPARQLHPSLIKPQGLSSFVRWSQSREVSPQCVCERRGVQEPNPPRRETSNIFEKLKICIWPT